MVDMNKENTSANYEEEPTVRITRARAKALSAGETQKPPRPDQKRLIRMNSKRAASDENKPTFSAATSLQNKRRAVLTDVTNTHCDGSYMACLNAAKIQTNKQTKRNVMRKNLKATSALPTEIHHAQDVKEKIAEDISKLSMESRHVNVPVGATVVGDTSKLAKKHHDDLTSGELKEYSTGGPIASSTPEEFSLEDVFADRSSKCSSRLHRLFKKDVRASKVSGTIDYPHVVDVDSKQKDPLMCNLYAPDIYENKRVMELKQRPPTKYMETVQRDITESMRGILIDWLVEVSEEYKLVPDTLYLTVNLIDRFLSGNYIEKQRLQLLGVTCMLIASKYEEICAPRVEEFCFITDNTYTREEVLKMECQALNFLCFHLATPTIKTFLRRFIQAAQATYEDPNVDLEFLANYLAELTLIDYNFLKFLPSLIAASAVFLARWTLDQSVHPWNPTLEHYTCYKAADLKSMVIAMQALQINANSCPLSSIREKYKRPKFNAVANFPSPKPVISLF